MINKKDMMSKPSILKTVAFTLVELLIAASLFSVIILSLYAVFHAGVLSYKKVNLSSDRLKEIQLFFNAFEFDLRNVFIYSSEDSGFSGDRQSCCFFTLLNSYDNQAHRVCDICFVGYKADGPVLKASFCKGLSALQNDECRQETMLSFPQGEIVFSYAFALSEDTQTYLWQDSWPATEDGAQKAKTLPLAVQVELNLSKEDKNVGSLAIQRIIALPLRVCKV